MRVCVLSDEYITGFDPSPYLKDFDWELFTMTAPVEEKLRVLADMHKYDVYLNVCEGYEFEDDEDDEIGYQSVEVVQALEKLGRPISERQRTYFLQR